MSLVCSTASPEQITDLEAQYTLLRIYSTARHYCAQDPARERFEATEYDIKIIITCDEVPLLIAGARSEIERLESLAKR